MAGVSIRATHAPSTFLRCARPPGRRALIASCPEAVALRGGPPVATSAKEREQIAELVAELAARMSAAEERIRELAKETTRTVDVLERTVELVGEGFGLAKPTQADVPPASVVDMAEYMRRKTDDVDA